MLARRHIPFLALALALAALLGPGSSRAQEAAAQVEDRRANVGLPAMEQLVMAMASPETRRQTLLDIAAVANVRRRSAGLLAGANSGANFANDREWLNIQVSRFGWFEPRSPVLDPAAWRVQQQLQPLGLANTELASPLGPGLEPLLAQAFDRADPLLAAGVLPELLWELETRASLIWSEVLAERVPEQGDAEQAGAAGLPWLVSWDFPLAGSIAPLGVEPAESLALALDLVQAMAWQLTRAGPPDAARLQRIRAGLLGAMPALEPPARAQAVHLLHLAGLLDGLNEQRFFGFAEGLVAITAQLSLEVDLYPQEVTGVATLLRDILPDISATYARDFAAVDPRLNTAMAVAYDAAQALARQPLDAAGRQRLADELADVVARLALLVPDMGYYFDLPVRDPVAGGVDACAGLLAVDAIDGVPALTRELFDDCLQSLLELADGVAREAQLAGDPNGPFGELQLNRELSLTAGQRINYGLGYLHQQYATGCELPSRPVPNPLEWAFLATFMTWFAEQSPVYFQTPENEQRLARMREIGTELTTTISEKVDCIAGVGVGVNDPVKRITAGYRAELRRLALQLQAAQQEFRDRYLAPGADVDLGGEPGQATAYRPAQLQILPCDASNVCEMSQPLSSTRALVGLFPDPYLLADQSGLGKVEICYDEMGWQERRSEPVRPGDENVANYYGKLAFTVRGRFNGPQGVDELFAFRFVSPQEYHYMFGAASSEVLDDECPMEWIGQRIVTSMPGQEKGLVPNRLTYLSAPRSLPSRLLSANWDRGSEWRDWFVTGIGVDSLPVPPASDIGPLLSQHLQRLRRLEQEAIYGSLLQRNTSFGDQGLAPLHRELNRLGNAKSLIRLQLMLFYPHVLTQSDDLRAAMAGNSGLLDPMVLNRFREQRVPVIDMLSIADERLQFFENRWEAVPEAIRRRGSTSGSVVHASARLNALQDRFFAAAPVQAPEPADSDDALSAPLAGDQGEAVEESDGQ